MENEDWGENENKKKKRVEGDKVFWEDRKENVDIDCNEIFLIKGQKEYNLLNISIMCIIPLFLSRSCMEDLTLFETYL